MGRGEGAACTVRERLVTEGCILQCFRDAGTDGPFQPRGRSSVLRCNILVWQNCKAVCMTENGVAHMLADFSPIDVKRDKSDSVCSREGLFSVCGRAAELGSFAFDNASEMLLASELFVLK